MATTHEEINEILSELRRDQRELIKHIISITWHMRGGLRWEDAWRLSPEMRGHIDTYISERMKFIEKTNMPIL